MLHRTASFGHLRFRFQTGDWDAAPSSGCLEPDSRWADPFALRAVLRSRGYANRGMVGRAPAAQASGLNFMVNGRDNGYRLSWRATIGGRRSRHACLAAVAGLPPADRMIGRDRIRSSVVNIDRSWDWLSDKVVERSPPLPCDPSQKHGSRARHKFAIEGFAHRTVHR